MSVKESRIFEYLSKTLESNELLDWLENLAALNLNSSTRWTTAVGSRLTFPEQLTCSSWPRYATIRLESRSLGQKTGKCQKWQEPVSSIVRLNEPLTLEQWLPGRSVSSWWSRTTLTTLPANQIRGELGNCPGVNWPHRHWLNAKSQTRAKESVRLRRRACAHWIRSADWATMTLTMTVHCAPDRPCSGRCLWMPGTRWSSSYFRGTFEVHSKSRRVGTSLCTRIFSGALARFHNLLPSSSQFFPVPTSGFLRFLRILRENLCAKIRSLECNKTRRKIL